MALLVNIDQPLPAREPVDAGQAVAPADGPEVVTGGGTPGLPVIQPGQVTAPGALAAAQPLQPAQPLVVAP